MTNDEIKAHMDILKEEKDRAVKSYLMDVEHRMTNEEAITILKREFSECKDTISVYAQKRKKAFDMAIKALEQEDLLDKIREEIANHCGLLKQNHCRYCSYCNSVMGVREIIEIIDKYKAESEDKE